MFVLSLILYGLLGAALSYAGVSVVENTAEYLVIVALVIAIEITGRLRG